MFLACPGSDSAAGVRYILFVAQINIRVCYRNHITIDQPKKAKYGLIVRKAQNYPVLRSRYIQFEI